MELRTSLCSALRSPYQRNATVVGVYTTLDRGDSLTSRILVPGFILAEQGIASQPHKTGSRSPGIYLTNTSAVLAYTPLLVCLGTARRITPPNTYSFSLQVLRGPTDAVLRHGLCSVEQPHESLGGNRGPLRRCVWLSYVVSDA